MKRVIKAARSYETQEYVVKDGTKYSVKYTYAEDLYAVDMYIGTIHPYDDADYAYAFIEDGIMKIYTYVNGRPKLIRRHYIIDNIEHTQGRPAELEDIIDYTIYELQDANKNVKPKMMYN